MFERLNTPEEAYNYKLGAALTMENKVIAILESTSAKPKTRRLRRYSAITSKRPTVM
jgi:hypothetical protein